MRNAFADEITKLAASDERIILLSGDIGNRLFDGLKEARASQFYNCGIAESSMMGIAAGLGLSGYRPVVYTITPFTTVRCLEQIRVDVCYHNSPVIIVGTGAGLSYAQLGPTHHSLEDVSILRSLPDMTVFCPCDSLELRSGLRAALNSDGPVYIRIGKKGEPDLHEKEPDVELGRSITMLDGDDICILSLGNMMSIALDAAARLETDGISTRVESFHTVKPLDAACLKEISEKFPTVAVLEEHSRIGGLFGAVSEWVASQARQGIRLLPFGLDDRFIHRVGSQQQMRERAGLTGSAVAQTLKSFHVRPQGAGSCG